MASGVEWDMSQIYTLHATNSSQVCARVQQLSRCLIEGADHRQCVLSALETPCDCGAGDHPSESTSLRED